jgi:hypothetical protein
MGNISTFFYIDMLTVSKQDKADIHFRSDEYYTSSRIEGFSSRMYDFTQIYLTFQQYLDEL